MKRGDKFIIPTSHLTAKVSELMVEAQSFSLPFETAMAIVTDAMQTEKQTDWYGANDTIVNALYALESEQEEGETPYSENMTLINGLVHLSNKLESICKNTIYNGSPFKDKFPLIVVEEIMMSGDLIVRVEASEGEQ